MLGVASLLARTPRISVLRLLGDNSGIYGLNVLDVMQDTQWITRLTASMAMIAEINLQPHVGQVFAADDVASAHTCLAMKQATGKLLLAWG
jgi:NADPH:quinone reductase-like Zn-dependent oxidoreductase